MGLCKYLFSLISFLTERIEKLERTIRMLQRKLKAARTDPTTGADSLFAFNEDKARKVRLFVEHGGAVLFIDLDNLKRANDVFGHHIGNELLRELAEISMRHNEPLGKYCRIHRHGGDEFLDIAPRIHHRKLEKIGRLIKQDFDEFCRPYNEGVTDRKNIIGVSVGCAGGKDLEEVIRRADMRMYRKKHKAKGVVR